ncbi:MAG: glycosyltransferase family 2 protein [Capsulimonadaceae bacterium]
MSDIDVIVVNWNACQDLRRCLASLRAEQRSAGDAGASAGPPPKIHAWVVDNASTDGSAGMVKSEFPEVCLIENTENAGFSRGNNQAIAASHGRYVFLLNSDAFVHPGALRTLVEFADAHPTTGIIGPKVLNSDGSLQFSCRRFPSLGAGFFRNTLLGRLFPRNRYAREYLMGDFDHSKTREVDWVSGCAMLIRRDLIDRIGALDERFYMYCEDVDICARAWDDGFSVMFCPDAVVTHAIGRSSDKNAEKMIIEFHRSWIELDKKRHPGFHPFRQAAVAAGCNLRAMVRIVHRRHSDRKRRLKPGAPPEL